MSAVNDVTGDKLISKVSNDTYRNNYDKIFGAKATKTYFNGCKVLTEEVEEWVTKEKDENPNT